MPIYEFEGRKPRVGKTSFIHPDAVLIGDVRIAGTCFIGAGAVLRADWGTIFIGEGSNVQENAVLHAPINAIGERPAVKRAVAACTERSTISANAVDA